MVAVVGLKTRQGRARAQAVMVLCGRLGTKAHDAGTAVAWLWTRTRRGAEAQGGRRWWWLGVTPP
jgi:hypothetical protein